ncbi:MAG: histidine phosphatase family protein, partial [Bacillota bacterium]|nr:histidine phosphatase family protein [Bacillota bacterium]
MKNLYLVRHGETELNKTKVYYGSTDCPLTEKGRSQSQGLSEVFSQIDIDVIYTSPLRRAVDTASIIFGDREFVREPRLEEMDFGQWEGKHYTELQGDPLFEKWQREWKTTRPPEGESFNDLNQRVESFWSDLRGAGADNVAIVGH